MCVCHTQRGEIYFPKRGISVFVLCKCACHLQGLDKSKDAFDYGDDSGDIDNDCPVCVLCRSLCWNVKWRDRKFKERESQGGSNLCFGLQMKRDFFMKLYFSLLFRF